MGFIRQKELSFLLNETSVLRGGRGGRNLALREGVVKTWDGPPCIKKEAHTNIPTPLPRALCGGERMVYCLFLSIFGD